MSKKFIKRLLATVVSAATLLSSAAVTTCSPVVTAAGDQDYGQALEMSLYFFDANECGLGVDDNPLTWRGNCHTYDSQASLDSAYGLGSTEKDFIKSANGGSNTVDLSGGYHDAGDHVKFAKTMGFAGACLAWSYFSYPDAYKETGCEAHLFDILKENSDFLMKSTYLNANDEVVAFCYMVSNESDHNEWYAPEKQTSARPTYWASPSNPDGCTAGLMSASFASTALALDDVDADYAQECLKYAKALLAFAKKYPKAATEGYGSMYQNSNTSEDEIAFAEAWVAIAENGGTLPSSFNPTYKATGNGVYNNNIYDCWIYSWDKVWGGYATLLAEVGYNESTYLKEVEFELNNNGGLSSSSYNAKGWGASRYNCALQRYALELADGNSQSSYAQGAKYQMDYLLGSNQKSTSFLLGYGDKWPMQVHHRGANENKTGMTYTLYGALVGGPTDSNCTYTDYWDQYQSTEPAIDYNGCFALACAGLYELYGGTTETADQIVASASEIDASHEFGAWYSSVEPPTEPETEPTTEPTEPTTEPVTTTEPVITTEPTTTTEPIVDPTEPTTGGEIPVGNKYGDVNLDNQVDIADVVSLNSYLLNAEGCPLTADALANADVARDNVVDSTDSGVLMNYVAMLVGYDELGK